MTTRALVLGGGGAAGSAWEVGVIAGLDDGGLDVTDADVVIGTSAGATVGAQVTGARAADLLAAILDSPSPVSRGPVKSLATRGSMTDLLAQTGGIIGEAADPGEMRRGLGAAALELDGAPGQRPWRDIVAARLPNPHWPQQVLRIVAVDAHTGDPMVFDRDSGADLVDAVAASTAGPGAPPVPIGDRRYIDGGYRAGENADLAAGFARVLVLAPFGGRTRMPLDWGIHLAPQVDELRARGSRVETVFPDENSRNAFGPTMMELSTRAPAAQAGFEQGRSLADRLGDFWA